MDCEPVAVVSDIHGNDLAFAAVVAELERLDVARGICLGDAVQSGDQPREVLDRLADLGWPVILGNSDDFLLEVPGAPREPWTQRHLERRAWTLAQLEPAHLDQIRSFARVADLDLGDGLRMRAFHGSPSSYEDILLPETTDLSPWSCAGFDVLAGGHTHRQWSRLIDGALYFNPGSVGISHDGLAEFAIATGTSVAFKRVAWNPR